MTARTLCRILVIMFLPLAAYSKTQAQTPGEQVEKVKTTLTVLPIAPLLKLVPSDFYRNDPPAETSKAYQLRTPGGDLIIIDANADGILDEEHDWMTVPNEKMLVPFSSSFCFPQGSLNIVSFDLSGKIINAELVTHRSLNKNVYESMYLLNRVRLRHGMAAVSLDFAHCKACDQHAAYVAANGNTGMDLHKETAGKPGYSPEGAAAAAASSIFPGKGDLRIAMDSWLRSAWHSSRLMDPSTKVCGVTNKANLCMFYRNYRNNYKPKNPSFVYPAPNSSAVPLAFAFGEIPAPLPGRSTAGLGMPITWQLAQRDTKDLTIALFLPARGKNVPVQGFASSPSKPSNPKEWPTNSGLHLFIPAAPLRPNTEYLVQIRNGDQVVRESRFTTGTSMDYLSGR